MTCGTIWPRRIFKDLLCEQNGTRIILYDNMSAIVMSNFFTLGQCIELNHHFIRDFVEKSKIELMFINTKEQMTDHKNFHSKQV